MTSRFQGTARMDPASGRPRRRRAAIHGALVGLVLAWQSEAGVVGTGTAVSCTELALNAQIVLGGNVTFNCGAAPVTIPMLGTGISQTNPAVVVDGGGKVTLDGSTAVGPMIAVNGSAGSIPDVTFRNLTFANGHNPGPAYAGGGAIYNQGKLTLDTVTFQGNQAVAAGGALLQIQCTGCLVPSTTIRYSQFNSNHTPGNGGAIFVQNGSLTIDDTDFSSNQATGGDGGAIYLFSGTGTPGSLVVRNGHFHLNASAGTGGGGAICAMAGAGGSASVDSSTFDLNSCSGLTSSGGAIHAQQTPLQVTGSLFASNSALSASGWGGAIGASSNTVTLQDSTFHGNVAGNGTTSSGSGAVGFTGVAGTVRRCTFRANAAHGNNTAGALGSNGSVSVENSTFSSNSVGGATGYGGAMYVQSGTLDLRNVTVTLNAANSSGAIVVAPSGTLRLRNSIVAGNTATGGGGGSNTQIGVSGTFLSDGHNLIGDATGLILNNDVVNANPNLGALANNGGPTFGNVVVVGPTFTHLPNAGSPAIDAGDPAGCTAIGGGLLGADQRNAARPSPAGGRCDIGAVEVQGVGPAARLAFVQQPTNAAAGAAIGPAVTVQLQDAGGAAVAQAGIQVAVALGFGSGTLSGTATQATNASGLATFANLSVNLAGTKTLSATSAGLAGATSASFLVSAGAPAVLTIAGGDSQTAMVGTAFPTPLSVNVADALGNRIPGLTVTFAAPASGASAGLAGSPATTDAGGTATVSATANGSPGTYPVTAAHGTLTPVTFSLTNAAAPAAATDVPALDGLGMAALGAALGLAGLLLVRRGE